MKRVKITKSIIGITFLSIGLLLFLFSHYFKGNPLFNWEPIIKFLVAIFILLGIILVIPYKKIQEYIFDPRVYERNKDISSLILSLRLRAILLNNLSVIVLFTTIIVIVVGFYILINPPKVITQQYDKIAIMSSVTVLLIFLVQILFRVFKYILRIASFYNGKADAIEYYLLRHDMGLEKLMDQFTPDKYDISDIPQPSLTSKLKDILNK